jgi:hypothetical protein
VEAGISFGGLPPHIPVPTPSLIQFFQLLPLSPLVINCHKGQVVSNHCEPIEVNMFDTIEEAVTGFSILKLAIYRANS